MQSDADQPLEQAPDDILLQRLARHQDEDALECLIHRHWKLVVRTATQVVDKHLAEDVAQDTFIRLVEKSALLSPNSNLQGWLTKVARQKALDVYKSSQKRRNRELVAEEDKVSRPHLPDSSTLNLILNEEINTLPGDLRSTIRSYYFEGKSIREIANKENLSSSAVSMRLTRARKELGMQLKRHGYGRWLILALITSGLRHQSSAVTSGGVALSLLMKAAVVAGLLVIPLGVITVGEVPTEATAMNAEPDVPRRAIARPAPLPEQHPLFHVLREQSGWQSTAFKQALDATTEPLDQIRNLAGETPLHVAVRKCYEHEVFLMLMAGTEPDIEDAQGQTPMHLVAGKKRGDAYLIRDMLAVADARIDAYDKEGWTPLMRAAEAGASDTVEFLIWLGASVHPKTGGHLGNPDAIARNAGHLETATMLETVAMNERIITRKTHPKVIPDRIERVFTQAAAQKDYFLLEDLLAQGININTKDESGQTALHRAVGGCHPDVITFLLLMGADPNQTDRDGNTPLMGTSGWLSFDSDWMKLMLLIAGTDVLHINRGGDSTIGRMARSGNEQGTQVAIWSGADPKAPASKETPLKIASEHGYQRVVEVLRRNGVTEEEIPDTERDPETLLALATKRGDLAAISQAAHQLDSIDIIEKKRKWAILVAAIHHRQIDAARHLIQLGADPELKSGDGTDALWATVCWSYHEVDLFRQELIDAGANINTTSNNGTTAVMRASSHGSLGPGLKQLVKAGADLNATNNKGQTALDIALKSGRNEAAEYLKRQGALTGEQVNSGILTYTR